MLQMWDGGRCSTCLDMTCLNCASGHFSWCRPQKLRVYKDCETAALRLVPATVTSSLQALCAITGIPPCLVPATEKSIPEALATLSQCFTNWFPRHWGRCHNVSPTDSRGIGDAVTMFHRLIPKALGTLSQCLGTHPLPPFSCLLWKSFYWLFVFHSVTKQILQRWQLTRGKACVINS